jgi:hypothetical protein
VAIHGWQFFFHMFRFLASKENIRFGGLAEIVSTGVVWQNGSAAHHVAQPVTWQSLHSTCDVHFL